MMNKTYLGIGIALGGSFMLALMSVFVKAIGQDVSEAFTLFCRFIISLLMILPFVLQIKKEDRFYIDNWGRLLARSIFGLGSMAILFFTIHHLPLADTTLLLNTSTLFVPIAVWVLMKIHTRKIVWLGILIALVGITLVLRPDSALFGWPAFVGLLGGLCAAIAVVLLRMLMKNPKNNPNTALFHYFIFTSLIAVFFCFFDWKTPHLIDWIYLLAIGVFGGGYQIALTYSSKFIQVRTVSAIMLTGVIFSAFFDWIIWGNKPDLYTIIGSAIVCLGVLIVALFNR